MHAAAAATLDVVTVADSLVMIFLLNHFVARRKCNKCGMFTEFFSRMLQMQLQQTNLAF